MSIFDPAPSPWPSRMLSILCILSGVVFITFGAMKLFNVAFILSGEMAVAYFLGHFPMGFWPSQNFGTPAILYCFLFLYFVFSGAGVWSIDAMIARSRANRI